MRAILLIAINLLRENRWTLLAMVLIALAYAPLVDSSSGRSVQDLEFYVGQESAYALPLAAFLAAFAIFNERKTRRILAVLSKGIARRQYIAGMLCGVFAASGLQLISVAAGASWIANRLSLSIASVWIAALLLWIACCLTATVSLFFATFLHPLLAVACTSVLIAFPLATRHLLPSLVLMPVYTLALAAVRRAASLHSAPLWSPVVLALIEGIIFWWLAGWIFSRRDIAVAIE